MNAVRSHPASISCQPSGVYSPRAPLPITPAVRRLPVRALVAAAALALAPAASAAQLIDRNAVDVQLAVNRQGVALLTYTAGGKLKHVLASGAINALPPSRRSLNPRNPDAISTIPSRSSSIRAAPRSGPPG